MGVSKKKKAKVDAPANGENQDIVNPGDCIGHWLDGDKSCEMCEIQDSCKDMTMAIQEKEAGNE